MRVKRRRVRGRDIKDSDSLVGLRRRDKFTVRFGTLEPDGTLSWDRDTVGCFSSKSAAARWARLISRGNEVYRVIRGTSAPVT